METRKNLCAMLPVALHTRVRQEQEKAGMTLGEYVEAMITEYYDWKDGKIMTGEMRTLAAQIPAELFDRLDRYLKERGIKKKDFLVDIITRALEEAEAAEPVTEASPQDELEELRLHHRVVHLRTGDIQPRHGVGVFAFGIGKLRLPVDGGDRGRLHFGGAGGIFNGIGIFLIAAHDACGHGKEQNHHAKHGSDDPSDSFHNAFSCRAGAAAWLKVLCVRTKCFL